MPDPLIYQAVFWDAGIVIDRPQMKILERDTSRALMAGNWRGVDVLLSSSTLHY